MFAVKQNGTKDILQKCLVDCVGNIAAKTGINEWSNYFSYLTWREAEQRHGLLELAQEDRISNGARRKMRCGKCEDRFDLIGFMRLKNERYEM